MFEWNDSFSVKIPIFDAQHKKLFEVGNRLSKLIETDALTNNFEEAMTSIHSEIKDMYDYTYYHFSQEEMMMRSYDFPGLEDHIVEHKTFLTYLKSIDIDHINENHTDAISEIIRFIASWIFKHINHTDFKYSDFLNTKMSEKPIR